MTYQTLPESRLPENHQSPVRGNAYIGRHRREVPAPRPAPPTEAEYLARLRELAFERFLVHSADLHAAHYRPLPDAPARLLWLLRWFLWVFALGLVPMPRPYRSGRSGVGDPASLRAFGRAPVRPAYSVAGESNPRSRTEPRRPAATAPTPAPISMRTVPRQQHPGYRRLPPLATVPYFPV
ncbi:hypothetical protein [Glycomyces buryatensis]|uniref:Uncharacterized protein n=1 Tax=Glycomyces buryatensis TaxID=2570927 RepID=A0A4S8Q541_9ACTN|nr:hypothetical protein [Glycomyces buryatensis]THV37762.1 hypothetical protein FAB82_20190 [Glycomyces buryatensis]